MFNRANLINWACSPDNVSLWYTHLFIVPFSSQMYNTSRNNNVRSISIPILNLMFGLTLSMIMCSLCTSHAITNTSSTYRLYTANQDNWWLIFQSKYPMKTSQDPTHSPLIHHLSACSMFQWKHNSALAVHEGISLYNWNTVSSSGIVSFVDITVIMSST